MGLLKIVLTYSCLLFTACVPLNRVISVDDLRQGQQLLIEGTDSLAQGDLERAEAAFSVARDLTASPEAADGLGCVAFARGDYQLAEEFYKEALAVSENAYTHVYIHLALVYELMKKSELAAQYHYLAVEFNPGSVEANNNAAAFFADSQKDKEAAKILFKRALAIKQDSLVANNLENIENLK